MELIGLAGVGKTTADKFASMGIRTIWELIEYFPRDYLDRSIITPIAELSPGGVYTVCARLVQKPLLSYIKGKSIIKAHFEDQTGSVFVTWFNQPFLVHALKDGGVYYLTGKATYAQGRMGIESPEYEEYGAESLSAGRIVPKYRLTATISQKQLRKAMAEGLKHLQGHIPDFFPADFLKKHSLCERSFAIENIHFPLSKDAYFAARRRLVFEELLIMQLALLGIKGHSEQKSDFIFADIDISPVLDKLPYRLTNAQNKALTETMADIEKSKLSNRLIQGDVGSGKTAVALILSYLAAKNGYQGAIMAPTETLANQHYISFCEILGDMGFHIALLTGAVKAKDKKRIKEELISGKIDIIIGTHALIVDNVEFCKLALVVTDEQHRFGVRQRMKLSEKGLPHTLVMTATPIPRTLAMVLYGDLDISTIDELPPGRKIIDTYSVNTSYRARIHAFIGKEIEAGNQAYIICPLVEDSEAEGFESLQSVTSYEKGLKSGGLSNIRTAILHGRMKSTEKAEIMQGFADGSIDVLISTTVVEVGINVPNATVMLIENAERFGLSQLHQLRGRVGRSDKKSYCILLTDSKSKITRERMAAMTKTNNGFELAELDLKLRGPGEFFGTLQHGLPPFKLANLYTDMAIFEETRVATAYIRNQNLLQTPAYEKLGRRVEEKGTLVLCV